MYQMDRSVKILLAIIAVLLFLLVARGGKDAGIHTSAQAAAAQQVPIRVDVPLIKEINLNKDVKEVILLGDQKTFLVRVDKGIAVFQVQEYYQ